MKQLIFETNRRMELSLGTDDRLINVMEEPLYIVSALCCNGDDNEAK